jgi:hypothetical protein
MSDDRLATTIKLKSGLTTADTISVRTLSVIFGKIALTIGQTRSLRLRKTTSAPRAKVAEKHSWRMKKCPLPPTTRLKLMKVSHDRSVPNQTPTVPNLIRAIREPGEPPKGVTPVTTKLL